MPPLEDAALRNLLAELPLRDDDASTPDPRLAARLATWAVELGERDWLPCMLVLPALRGRITATMLAAAVTELWRLNAFERHRLARLAGCLHAAHPGVLPPRVRQTMTLFDALRPERTAPLLRLGMMDGWSRDPDLGRLAGGQLGFGPQLLPFVWYSRLTEFEWVLVARTARAFSHCPSPSGLGQSGGRQSSFAAPRLGARLRPAGSASFHQTIGAHTTEAAATATVRRWVALRDMLRGGAGARRYGRLSALPDPAARTIADMLGLPAEMYAIGTR